MPNKFEHFQPIMYDPIINDSKARELGEFKHAESNDGVVHATFQYFMKSLITKTALDA